MKKSLLVFLFTTAFMTATACAETLTLTTYYPAPFGAYDQFRLVPRAALSGACQVGTIYVQTPDKIQYCRDNGGTGTWGTFPGVWTQNGNNIYPTDTASNPNLMVGIGTITPYSHLDITGSGPGLTLKRTNNATEHSIYFRNSGNAFPARIYTTGATSGDLRFALGPANQDPLALVDVLTLTNAGRIGIGTTTPNAKLSFVNNVATGFLDSYGEYQIILWDGGAANTAYGIGIKPNTMVFNSGSGAYSFDRSGAATTMAMDTAGRVGIGTTAPARSLEVNGDGQVNKLFLKANGTNVGEFKAAYSGGNYYATYAP